MNSSRAAAGPGSRRSVVAWGVDLLERVLNLSALALLMSSVLIVSLWGWVFKPAREAMILIPYRVRKYHEIHRLFTAAWLHKDLSHLGLNMLMLYYFAREAIPLLGATRFVILYLTAAVVAFIPTTLRYMRDPRYSSLGASGAIAAVMISAILLHPKIKFYVLFLPVPVPAAAFAVVYLAYSAWHSIASGDNINHDAHFYGAAYGGLLTYVFEPARVERSIASVVALVRALR
jgi:membrane associated rhomboid family serine protease